MSEKVKVRFIIQIAGKPVENVEKALNIVEGKIKESKDFKVLESEIIEPELDEETTLYSGLIEMLIRFESIESVFEFIYDYTPNSVEIEEPENFKFDSARLTGLMNDFSNHMLKSAQEVRNLSAHFHIMKKELDELKSKK